jgi:hypothetical protein
LPYASTADAHDHVSTRHMNTYCFPASPYYVPNFLTSQLDIQIGKRT